MRRSAGLVKVGVRWFFGMVFLLLGASYLTSHVIASIASLALASLLIPPLEKLVFTKVKIKIPSWAKVVMGIFLVGVIGSNIPSTEKVAKTIESSSQTSSVESVKTTPTETQEKLHSILKVIDGDTVQIDIDGKPQVVRLIGEDTPESVDSRKPVQCFAVEATKKAKEVLADKKVALESDASQGDKDKYNRLLRYIFLEDGTNFSKLMISEGYAHEYTYQVPYKYMAEFKEAEKEAREAKRGLWADDACLVTPTPTVKTSNLSPTAVVVPTATTCGSKTKCTEMTSCAEAMYYLNTCGVSRLDGDKDGVPCETLCK